MFLNSGLKEIQGERQPILAVNEHDKRWETLTPIAFSLRIKLNLHSLPLSWLTPAPRTQKQHLQ